MAEDRIQNAEVLEFLELYQKLSDTQDFDQVAPLIHENAMCRFTDGDFEGTEAIRGVFEKTWALPVEENNYYLSDIKVVAADRSLAVATFVFNWSAVKDGREISTKGRGTIVLTKSGDRIQLLHEHLSH